MIWMIVLAILVLVLLSPVDAQENYQLLPIVIMAECALHAFYFYSVSALYHHHPLSIVTLLQPLKLTLYYFFLYSYARAKVLSSTY